MVYASFGIVAFLVVIIINYEVLNPRVDHRYFIAFEEYRRFLLSVLLFIALDFMWGILDAKEIMFWLYVDTVIYFLSMSLTVILWTQYVIKLLNNNNNNKWFEVLINFLCQIYAIYIIIILIINFYKPIIFSYDTKYEFTSGTARLITYEIQIGFFLLVAIYTLLQGGKRKDREGWRYLAIGAFGIEQLICIGIQMYYWVVPVYTIGCLIGTCTLHTFVFEDRKVEYQEKLEKLLEINKEQKEEIGSAKQVAYRDPLTGVKSKNAYVEAVEKLNDSIKKEIITDLGIMVFDLNDLKTVNDTLGHEAGDQYIKDGCMMICKKFAHSPVFRIGGDEFTVILQGSDFNNREGLISEFENEVEENLKSNKVVVASGLGIYIPDKDKYVDDIFERADKKMYERKKSLKEMK